MPVPRHQFGPGADRVPLIRHAALCAGALVACLLREQLQVRNTLLWIILAAAFLNLLASIGWNRKPPGVIARAASTLLGLGGWGVLAALTGGARSPFIAGLFMEVVLSGFASTPASLLTTGGAVVGLWAQVLERPAEGHVATLALLTAFLIATGALTLRLAERWRRVNDRMSRRIAVLQRRLDLLERELRTTRAPADGSGDAALLAHSLKNAVHSMRGFVQLLEPRLQRASGCDELLRGLRSAINHLESLSRAVLTPLVAGRATTAEDSRAAQAAVREAVDQVAAAFPGVRWSVAAQESPLVAGALAPLVRDALINLLRNAAEAMEGEGHVQVEAAPRDGRLVIRVRDHGPGMPIDAITRGFAAGRTTKADGHGLGLLLTRRLLEGAGGHLTVSPAEGGGLVCALELPLVPAAGTLAGAAGTR